jgi:hypothetical protein
VAFGYTITDEIINFEPLEDKLSVLKRKSMKTVYDVVLQLKARLTFFAVYNLFDTVELNHIDSQAGL